MDTLLTINISFSVLLLMVAIYLKDPSDFSTFPSVILLGTAFRLALSVGTTRLILSEANAGSIIETFGDFVISGSIAIGLVIFLIITVVQFLVVTKGAERVAEVAARFTLDALPGKQMTIDAQVKAGDIDPEEGALQRAKLDINSQFFGAMDGAMKFVKGDAIAGIIIIIINLLGGAAVGVQLHGLSLGESISTFAILTVGDGLVAQIPALLMSLSAGIIVTRVTSAQSRDLGNDIFTEVVADPRVPAIAAGVIILIGLVPGFPTLTFVAFACVLFASSIFLKNRMKAERIAEAASEDIADETQQSDDNHEFRKSQLGESERIKILLGREIQSHFDVAELERQLVERFWVFYAASGIRFSFPKIVTDDPDILSNQWKVALDDVPLLTGTLKPNEVLVTSDRNEVEELLELETVSVFESPIISGVWVSKQHLPKIEQMSLNMMAAEDVLSLVTFRSFEQNVGTIFTLSELNEYLNSLREVDATTMELIEEEMALPSLSKLFGLLVQDGVPLRPPELVISSLHHWIHSLSEPTSAVLAECMRGALKRQMCHRISGKAGVLGLLLVSPGLERKIRKGMRNANQFLDDSLVDGLVFEPELNDAIVASFKAEEAKTRNSQYQPVIILPADLRHRFRVFMSANDVHLPVLAPHEVAKEVLSLPIGVIEDSNEGQIAA